MINIYFSCYDPDKYTTLIWYIKINVPIIKT